MQRYDRDTTYSVEEREGGFTLTVNVSRYQFIPETEAVIVSAKSAALSIAHDIAQMRGRPIKQINEQRLRVSTGRNGFSGVTSCTVQAPCDYQ